jgi:CBS domain-containing protein
MHSVRHLLQNKPVNQIYAIGSHQTVFEALERMAEKNCGALLVIDDERLVGVFSERDYARKGILQGRKAKSTSVKEVMTSGVYTVTPNQDMNDCMNLMSSKKIRHLPVMDGESIVGLLSIGDIVTAVMNEQKGRIESLEQYITGY